MNVVCVSFPEVLPKFYGWTAKSMETCIYTLGLFELWVFLVAYLMIVLLPMSKCCIETDTLGPGCSEILVSKTAFRCLYTFTGLCKRNADAGKFCTKVSVTSGRRKISFLH